MWGDDRCPRSSRSASSSILGRFGTTFAVRRCAVEQSLQWCWRVGVVSTKVHWSYLFGGCGSASRGCCGGLWAGDDVACAEVGDHKPWLWVLTVPSIGLSDWG